MMQVWSWGLVRVWSLFANVHEIDIMNQSLSLDDNQMLKEMSQVQIPPKP